MKPLPQTSLDHYCRLHEQAMANPTSPLDVTGVNSACIRAMYTRGLVEYEFRTVNDERTRRILFTELGLQYRCEMMAMAHAPQRTKTPRRREWVRMQFNMRDKDYRKAYKIAQELIQDDLLAPTVADLLLIHKQAEKGNYKLFYELYGIPDTKETRQFESMIQTIDKLTDEVRSLRENRANSSDRGGSRGNSQEGGVKAIQTAFRVQDPTFEDEDDSGLFQVAKDNNAGRRSAENFIKSVIDIPTSKGTVDPRQLSGRQREHMNLDAPAPDDDIEIEW